MSTVQANSTTPSGTATPTRITWPASRFYWSILDTARDGHPSTGRARPSRDYLDSLAEDDLPIPIEQLHLVHTRIDDGRFLACAVPKADLAELPPGTISLTPGEVPVELGLGWAPEPGAASPTPIKLPELLVGAFEPTPLIRERSKRWHLATAACVACTLLGTLGLLRRASDARDQAQELRSASRERAQSVLPGTPADLNTASTALQHELADLRSTHAPSASLAPDAGATLAQLLATLPTTTSLRTDVLAVTPATITLNVATDADPQPFLKALAAPQGWTLVEPRLTVLRSGTSGSAPGSDTNGAGATTTLAIQMRRALGGAP